MAEEINEKEIIIKTDDNEEYKIKITNTTTIQQIKQIILQYKQINLKNFNNLNLTNFNENNLIFQQIQQKNKQIKLYLNENKLFPEISNENSKECSFIFELNGFLNQINENKIRNQKFNLFNNILNQFSNEINLLVNERSFFFFSFFSFLF